MRLDKFLCDCGLGTRSQVKAIIKKKRVMVNGKVCDKPEVKTDENLDEVYVDGKRIAYTKYRYLIMNKPMGYVTARNDDIHQTVMDLVDFKDKGLSPVGRLDLDTEGLLIITNDGQFNHELMSPSHHVSKTYEAIIDSYTDEEDVKAFREGVDIGDDTPTLPAELEILKNYSEEETGLQRSKISLTITEGRYHQVKRMFEARGKKVIYLKRTAIGHLIIPCDLKSGMVRELTDEELKLIR